METPEGLKGPQGLPSTVIVITYGVGFCDIPESKTSRGPTKK